MAILCVPLAAQQRKPGPVQTATTVMSSASYLNIAVPTATVLLKCHRAYATNENDHANQLVDHYCIILVFLASQMTLSVVIGSKIFLTLFETSSAGLLAPG